MYHRDIWWDLLTANFKYAFLRVNNFYVLVIYET